MDTRNKIVVVTGASSGIGACIAKRMGREGAGRVVLLARDAEKLKQVAAEIDAMGARAHSFPVDLGDAASVARVAQQILEQVGVPDILINNAGSGQWKSLTESSAEEIQQAMVVPYLAAAWLTRELLPGMLKRGTGHIVNVSSVASRMAWPGATAYIVACRAMRGFSDALRADLHGSRIGVTHYESGPIDTPYWRNNPDSRERVPGIARLLVPVLNEEQVARAVASGIRLNCRFIVIPSMLKLVYLLHFLFPWLVQWLMTTTGYRKRAT